MTGRDRPIAVPLQSRTVPLLSHYRAGLSDSCPWHGKTAPTMSQTEQGCPTTVQRQDRTVPLLSHGCDLPSGTDIRRRDDRGQSVWFCRDDVTHTSRQPAHREFKCNNTRSNWTVNPSHAGNHDNPIVKWDIAVTVTAAIPAHWANVESLWVSGFISTLKTLLLFFTLFY